jgi:NOL1/NOP2/fmu family ribosome biogenesis protein
LPDSNMPKEEAIAFFGTRFGVAEEWLRALTFVERNNEIWATSASTLPPLASPRLPGLRALRRAPGGLKPTSVFLALLGNRITAARVDVDSNALHRLLLGHWAPAEASDGYVAIVYRGDVLGCGRAQDGRVRALLPTGRRRELLNTLLPPGSEHAIL